MDQRTNEIKFKGSYVTLLGKKTRVGRKAKNFTVINNDFEEVKFSSFVDKTVVISVVPSVDTPVCANQTKRFNEEAAKFEDVIILTISVDLPFALNRFCAGEGIDNLITLSDHKYLDFGKKYGFVIEELRLLTRGVLIIDKNNTIRYIEYVEEVTNYPDFEKALEKLNEIIK